MSRYIYRNQILELLVSISEHQQLSYHLPFVLLHMYKSIYFVLESVRKRHWQKRLICQPLTFCTPLGVVPNICFLFDKSVLLPETMDIAQTPQSAQTDMYINTGNRFTYNLIGLSKCYEHIHIKIRMLLHVYCKTIFVSVDSWNKVIIFKTSTTSPYSTLTSSPFLVLKLSPLQHYCHYCIIWIMTCSIFS